MSDRSYLNIVHGFWKERGIVDILFAVKTALDEVSGTEGSLLVTSC